MPLRPSGPRSRPAWSLCGTCPARERLRQEESSRGQQQQGERRGSGPGAGRERGAPGAELLDALVEMVGDIDAPGRVHGYALDPAELTRPAAEGSPSGQEGSVTAELLHPVVEVVGDVDVPVLIDGDPRRSGELPVSGSKGSPLREVFSVARELLDAVVRGVRDVHRPLRVDRDATGARELAVPGPWSAHWATNAPAPLSFWTRLLSWSAT